MRLFTLRFFVFVIRVGHSNTIRKCNGQGGCCDGYQFSAEINDCIKCADGYIGPNCVVPCPFPAYGFLCQKECECTEYYCNVTTGCPLDCTKFRDCSFFTTGKASSSPNDSSRTYIFRSLGQETEMDKKVFESGKDGFYLPYYGFIIMLALIPLIGLLLFLLKRLCNQLKERSPDYLDIQVPFSTEHYQGITIISGLQNEVEMNAEINQYDDLSNPQAMT